MPYLVELDCVDPARIAEVWPLARGLIKSAIDATELSDFGEFEGDILAGRQLLWLAITGTSIEAAATTQLSKVNGRLVCTLTACAGYCRERWLPLFLKIEQYAKDEGAVRMRLFGRKGWARILDGYHVEYLVLEKGLT